jgi:hypothetical protein
MDAYQEMGLTDGNSEDCVGYPFAEVGLCEILRLRQDHSRDLFWCLLVSKNPDVTACYCTRGGDHLQRSCVCLYARS